MAAGRAEGLLDSGSSQFSGEAPQIGLRIHDYTQCYRSVSFKRATTINEMRCIFFFNTVKAEKGIGFKTCRVPITVEAER